MLQTPTDAQAALERATCRVEEFRGVLEKASITTDRQNECGDSSGQGSCRECPSLLQETYVVTSRC